MKLTKKHIGKLVVAGSWTDGSWAYLVLDIKKDKALFLSIPGNKYEIEMPIRSDWRYYEIGKWLPALGPFGGLKTKESIKEGWKTGRVSD